MPDRQWGLTAIEIMHFPRLHICGANGQTGASGIEKLGNNQIAKRALEGLGRVISGPLSANPFLRTDPGGGIRLEKARNAAGNGGCVGGKGRNAYVRLASRNKGTLPHASPKFLKP